jgi:hypothetical protein
MKQNAILSGDTVSPCPIAFSIIVQEYTLPDEGRRHFAPDATRGVVKQARLENAPGDYFASPVAADDKIFTVSQEGKVSVIKPGKDWEILATNDLNEECYSTPAFGDGKLYIRTNKKLYCFGKQ